MTQKGWWLVRTRGAVGAWHYQNALDAEHAGVIFNNCKLHFEVYEVHFNGKPWMKAGHTSKVVDTKATGAVA